MKYEKIHSDLRLLKEVDKNDLGMNEVLNLVLDVLLDTIEETGREIESFSLSEEDIRVWVSVCRSLGSVSLNDVLNGDMALKRKQRVERTRGMLNQKLAEIETVSSIEKELEEKKHSFEQLKLTQEEQRKRIAQLIQSTDDLEQQVNAFESIDTETIENKKLYYENLLASKKSQKECLDKLGKDINDIDSEIQSINTEIGKTRNSIQDKESERDALIVELQQENTALSNAIQKNVADSRAKKLIEEQSKIILEISDNEAKLSDISVEMSKINTALEKSQQDYETKREELNKEKKRIDNLSKQNADSLNATQKEINNLKTSLSESIRNLSDVTQKKDNAKQAAKLVGELSEIVKTIGGIEDELADLNAKISESRNFIETLTDERKNLNYELEDVQKEKNGLDEEIKSLKENLKKLKTDKEQLSFEIDESKSNIEKYKKFFNSEECMYKRQKIDVNEKVLKMFQNGVSSIFKESVPAEYLEEQLRESLNSQREQFNQQMLQIDDAITILRNSYVQTISEIEKEANGV